MEGERTSTETDEAVMLRFCRTLDDAAFSELAHRYYAAALRLARSRLGNAALAQDTVQEAWLRVVRHRNRFDPSRKFSSWFFALLSNLCTDAYRKEMRRAEKHREFADAMSEPGLAVDTGPLRDAMGRLPPGDREVLLLRFGQGYTLAEVAEIQDITLDAAKKRAQRALRKLKEAIGPAMQG